MLAVKGCARREKPSVGKVRSDLARQSLTARGVPSEVAETGRFYGFHPLPPHGVTVSNDLIDRLRDCEVD